MHYILKKTGVLVVTLLAISVLVFFIFQCIPGDPVGTMLGTEYTPERAEELRIELGLDQPLFIQYLQWIKNFASGNLGMSYRYKMPVTEMIYGRMSITLSLTCLAFALVCLLSLPLGIFISRYSGGIFDRIFVIWNQITMSIPQFFIGIIFSYVFGMIFGLFTPGEFIYPEDGMAAYWGYLFFPALSIAIPKAAMATKLLRSSLQTEMAKDYVRTAYSWGNSRKRVLLHHVLRNGVMPVLTFFTVTLSDIVAGSVIIEQIFMIPGIGRLLLASIANRDYPVVAALVMLLSFFVIIIHYLSDVLYPMIDPRISL